MSGNRLCGVISLLFLLAATAAAESSWGSLGPPGGDVHRITIDPSNPSILYAGTFFGGLFKSTDGGANWRPINNGLRFLGSRDLAIDPLNPARIFIINGGVLKSTNGGETWEPADRDLPKPFVSTLAMDPTSPSTLYVGTQRNRIFKTTDGGDSWLPAGTGIHPQANIMTLSVDPVTPSVLYAGAENLGIYKTVDGAASWFLVNNGLKAPFEIYDVKVDPEQHFIVYAGIEDAYFDGVDTIIFDERLYRTTDGGGSWAVTLDPFNSVRQVAFDPTTSAIVYAASIEGLFRSTDRGETWSSLGGPTQQTSVVVHPQNPAMLWIGAGNHSTDVLGGIYKSTDGGQSFTPSNRGLHATHISAVSVDPFDPATIYVVTRPGGLFKTDDHGANWTVLAGEIEESFQDFKRVVAADPGQRGYVYLAADRLYRSTDSGATWRAMSEGLARTGGGRDVLRIVFDPTGVIYLATRGGVYRSDNRGFLWTHRSEGLPSTIFGIGMGGLDVAASDPDVLYTALDGEGVYKSTDAAATWTHQPGVLDERDVRALRVDPTDPAIVYAATDAGVLKSVDGGASFSAVNDGLADLQVEDLAIDPTAPLTVYAATQTAGVFQSLDGGANWDLYGGRDDLGNPNTRTVTLDPGNPGTVYVGTWGSGVSVRTASGCQAGETVLCLNRQRFQVEVQWRDFQGARGPGRKVSANSDDSGLFWFFSPDNWEMLVKVLDGCAVNGHYWVFSAATTNVELTLRVTDTETGRVKEYVNPLGVAADAVTDTSAFATCP